LKQLSESGLVCCTGPFKLNGVPLRRFQPKKLIATSTKVDLTGVTVPEQVNDKLFAREIIPKPKRSEQEFFNKAEKPKKKSLKDHVEFQKLQIAVDEPLIKNVQKTEHMESYLKTIFGLTKGVYPHALKF